ncbi:MAG TPA: hypothetical protein ENK84_01595 [Desulfobulbus sp.]|nr:hypothetical protein [Desulfobulbus sp.]
MLVLCACTASGPPGLDDPRACADSRNCASAFPRGSWQFVHLIEFSLADGAGGTVIGVTVLDGQTIKCALTTTEGMTLFEAESAGSLKVLRAVSPFDKPGFAQGLLADVRTIFVRPQAAPLCGMLDEGQSVCRYRNKSGITDVMSTEDGCPRITTWTAAGLPDRTITAHDCSLNHGYQLARSLVLQAVGKGGYILKMKLLRAQQGM